MTSEQRARFHAGDEATFHRLVVEYTPRLLGFVRPFARDGDDAHDLVQETWRRAFERRASYVGSGSILGWLFAIARNVSVSARRGGDRPGMTLDEHAPVARDDPHADAERSELRRRIVDALGTLPDRERDVVVYRLIEQRSTRETAALMSCAEGTVKAALHHAIKKLQPAMEVWIR